MIIGWLTWNGTRPVYADGRIGRPLEGRTVTAYSIAEILRQQASSDEKRG